MGLVLAGGGARGAYEAGVLSVLEPELEEDGARPEIVVGSSVGAINAAHVAATRHLPAAEAAERALETWSGVGKGDVIGPIISRQAPLTFARYAGEILSVPGIRVPSLLDPGPLHENLDHWIDWSALHANIAGGAVSSLATVATAVASGRTVAFVETAAGIPTQITHSVRYARTRLGAEHLRASAAIPILFPPVRLEDDAAHHGWYVDGGTRLNTPIKPALDLGSERLVIIATGAIAASAPSEDEDESEPPDFGTGALHLLHGALVDPLVEDMYRLGKINTFLAEGGAEAMGRFRSLRGQRPYGSVPYLFVAPERPQAIGELARTVFEDRYAGLKGLRSPDIRFLNRLIGGESPTHGELLSYLFFDSEFMRELIAMGQADARRALTRSAGRLPWRSEAPGNLAADSGRGAAGG